MKNRAVGSYLNLGRPEYEEALSTVRDCHWQMVLKIKLL
jgi:hypothetical protein